MKKTQKGNWEGLAFLSIRDRIRTSDEYRITRAVLLDKVLEKVVGGMVLDFTGTGTTERLKQLGGISKLIEDTLKSLVSEAGDPANRNQGSQMIPMSAADVLRSEIPDLRGVVQQKLASLLA